MDRVFDCTEKGFIFYHEHQDWFDWRGEKLQRLLDLYDTGFLKVMKRRDSEGRRIILVNNDLDMAKFNADDVFRLCTLVILLLSYEEETQFCGIIYVNDYSCGMTMKYLTMYPVKSLFDFTVQLTFTPVRLTNLIIVGLPSFGTQFLNIMKVALTDVMRKRLLALDNRSQLLNHIDKSILTTDFGGDADVSETIEDFRKIIIERVEIIHDIFGRVQIDMAKATALKNDHDTVGSFRKLEID